MRADNRLPPPRVALIGTGYSEFAARAHQAILEANPEGYRAMRGYADPGGAVPLSWGKTQVERKRRVFAMYGDRCRNCGVRPLAYRPDYLGAAPRGPLAERRTHARLKVVAAEGPCAQLEPWKQAGAAERERMFSAGQLLCHPCARARERYVGALDWPTVDAFRASVRRLDNVAEAARKHGIGTNTAYAIASARTWAPHTRARFVDGVLGMPPYAYIYARTLAWTPS